MNSENLNRVIALRHELHEHPELSQQEIWTKKHLMNFIKDHTKLEIVDGGNWFYAAYRGGNPKDGCIVFRADFDAIAVKETCPLSYASKYPGIAHKCGHDGHSAILCGLALEMDQKGSDQNIIFLFQHAEENGAGAAECLELLELEKVNRIFALHNMSGYPLKTILSRPGIIQCASKGLTIDFQGKNSHASMPEDGVNPSFAVAEMILYMKEVLETETFEGMVLGTMIHAEIGSRNFGISAGHGELSITLRALYEREMNRFEEKLREHAAELAKRDGLEVKFSITDPFPDTINDESCVNIVSKAAENQNLEYAMLPEVFRGSEDFGRYLQKCPGAIFYIGNGEDYTALHTSEYDFNDELVETAVDLDLEIIEQCK